MVLWKHPGSPPSRLAGTARRGHTRRAAAVTVGWILSLVGLLLGFSAARLSGEEKPATPVSEEQIKAAILVGFARATEWPTNTFTDSQKCFVIGMVGRDTLGDKATAIFSSHDAAKGRAVQFKIINDETEARACHVVFFPRSERRRARDLVERLKGAPVLLVGEWENFLDQNGMVNLVAKDGAMKFEINLDPVKGSNLRIPAKVLGAALNVRGKYE